jgi:hypothetical protein
VKLSVLVPSIRTENLKNLYDSIKQSFSEEFEFIVASPYDLPWVLKDIYNVKLIKTYRSPLAAQQQALIQSTGEWIIWCADDGECLPDMLDDSFKLLEGKDYKTIIVSKYLEGNNPVGMENKEYYMLHTHDNMRLKGVPINAMLLNCGVVSNQLLVELGGWDASKFEVCPMGYTDFSIRALKYGAEFILQDKPVFKCSHEPGLEGSHAPIHNAQTRKDEPIFKMIYYKENDRMVIPLDNWKQTEEVWSRRFNEGIASTA